MLNRPTGRPDRRTFAIISHPDAGKTTLTEKLLLFGGAIHLAGEVKARGQNRRARSDWMKIEQQRGISVTSSVMTFEHEGVTFNLLDTPGHEDFSEDTYRTLTAVDSAVMVIDAARGIEAQTRKLFEVCRLRNVPIITFVNKVDREGREPFELLDEIADVLALDVAPMSWPVGMGGTFEGVYDLRQDKLYLPAKSDSGHYEAGRCNSAGWTIRSWRRRSRTKGCQAARGGLAGVAAYPEFDADAYLAGDLTPVFFGSALKEFGVAELIASLSSFAPSPKRSRPPRDRSIPIQGGERLCVQGAGQYEPAASRPGRVHAALLRPVQARHEALAALHRQADRGALADPVLRPEPRARRRGPFPATSSASRTTGPCGSAIP
jgi:peptide chain release factor 3